MRGPSLILVILLLMACAAPGENDGRREDTALKDFIEVNELTSVDVIRIWDQLTAKRVNDTYYIVSTRKQDYLLEYYRHCMERMDGTVKPDVRRDARALYPRVDTFRGCRIKAAYPISPGQVEELRNIGSTYGD